MKKENKEKKINEFEAEKNMGDKNEGLGKVLLFKRRMLEWPNPVEYVNNMYGCHPDGPDDGGEDYFKRVFRYEK